MKLATIKIDQISAGDNIRKDITKESLESLIISIKEKGILQPLLVRANGGKFDLVAGYRRYNAAKHAKVEDIPVLVMDIEKDDRIEYQLAENLQRQDLNPIDEALAYKELGEDFSAKDLMVITGKSEYHIKRMLSLLNLCEDVKEMLKKRELSAEHGFVVARVHSSKFQKDLANDIKRYKYSPAKAESELRNFTDSLDAVNFDKAQCKTCTFNGSSMKDLFDKDNSLAGKCLNLDCFDKKIAELQNKKEAEYKKLGKKVIVVKEEPKYGSKEYEALKEIVDFSGYEASGFNKDQFKTECSATCPTFAIIIGTHGQEKPVCLNKECFQRSLRRAKAIERKANALPKTGNPEKDASIDFEMRQKANRVDLFKRNFFIKGIKENAKDVQINRLLLHQLFQSENGGDSTISEMLKITKKPNYEIRGLHRLNELTNNKLLEHVKTVILSRLNEYTTEELQALGEETGLNIGKQFVITQEYLEKFSKAGLMKLAKELKLKVGSLVWKDKKDEIIKTLLGSGVKGKVPKEMIK